MAEPKIEHQRGKPEPETQNCLEPKNRKIQKSFFEIRKTKMKSENGFRFKWTNPEFGNRFSKKRNQKPNDSRLFGTDSKLSDLNIFEK